MSGLACLIFGGKDPTPSHYEGDYDLTTRGDGAMWRLRAYQELEERDTKRKAHAARWRRSWLRGVVEAMRRSILRRRDSGRTEPPEIVRDRQEPNRIVESAGRGGTSDLETICGILLRAKYQDLPSKKLGHGEDRVFSVSKPAAHGFDASTSLDLSRGGYDGFVCVLLFDENGNLTDHAVWE